MDRPSQEPGPPPEATESPLSFPVEAPKLEGVEPGGGAPLGAAETTSAPLVFPEEVRRPPAVPSASSPEEASASADPLLFPDDVSRPPAVPSASSPEGASASADPLAFPVEATPPPAALPAFPSEATTPPGQTPQPPPPAEVLPFPVAQLPGVPAAVSQQAAAGAPEPAPIPDPTPEPGLPRFLAPLLTTVAALMAVGGSFLPLFRIRQPVSVRQAYFDAQVSITQTVWGNRVDIPGQESIDQTSSPVGIPLVVAIVILFAAALVAFSRPDRGLGRWLIGAGAVFTAGVVFTIGMSGLGWSGLADGNDLEVVTAVGMWLLIGATVLAAAAAVVAHLPGRRRDGDWADPDLAYADTPTPPIGVAITVLPPDPDEQRE